MPTPVRSPRPAVAVSVSCCLALALGALTPSADAALMAYDGFIAGGATPNTAAGQYATGTGFSGSPSDDLEGQSPSTFGFASGAWASPSSFSSSVYYRTEANQLEYRDAGNRRLNTTQGQAFLFRSGGTATDDKDMSRSLAIGNSLPDTLYISMLAQVSDGAGLVVRSASTNGSEERRFNFGIDQNGNPFVTGSGTGSGMDTNTSVTVDPTAPIFLVAKLTNDGFESDQIDLYLNPDLSAEGLNTPVATIDGGNFYVGGNASWTLADIFFRNNVFPVGESIAMDEIRIGSTWADVTPFTQVPEPTTAALALFGLAGLAARRRRA